MTTIQNVLGGAGNALQEIRGWFLNGGKSPKLAELANCMDERVDKVSNTLEQLGVTEIPGPFNDSCCTASDKRGTRYCMYDAKRFLTHAITAIEDSKGGGQDSKVQACIDELKELNGMLRQFGLRATDS